MFEKRSTPKMSKLKEVHSPESGVIVKTAKDGCAEGLIYGGGGKEGIFIKEVVPESPASKSLKLKEGDQILSATVYFDNVSYEDAIQILEHAQAYKVKLCLKRKPDITETEPAIDSNEEELYAPEMREQGKTKRRGDARISWPKFSSFGKGRKSRFTRSHSSSEADEQRKLELSPTTSDTESPIKSQDALKDGDVTLPEAKAGIKLPDAPKVDIDLGKADVSIPEMKIEVEKPELEVKPLQTEVELDGQGSKFKMPKFGIKMPKIKGPEFDLSMSKKDVDVTLPEAKADVKLPDVPDVDVTLGSAEVSIPGKKIEVEKPELEIKSLQTEVEPDGERIKFKMPKFGVKMPKIKGPEFDLSMSKKDGDVTLPETKV
ncbi:protein AHNAK2-like [Echeneis naucrates]|uniref:protein AHNAK2-like n=1 Tax=Echeneis naucrates TaxID=173247 RepID=UPI0011142886|nr:protein AHNAK2-like [Echeneis naucrates]